MLARLVLRRCCGPIPTLHSCPCELHLYVHNVALDSVVLLGIAIRSVNMEQDRLVVLCVATG